MLNGLLFVCLFCLLVLEVPTRRWYIYGINISKKRNNILYFKSWIIIHDKTKS